MASSGSTEPSTWATHPVHDARSYPAHLLCYYLWQVLFVTMDEVSFDFMDELAPGSTVMFPVEPGKVSTRFELRIKKRVLPCIGTYTAMIMKSLNASVLCIMKNPRKLSRRSMVWVALIGSRI